MNDTFSVHKGFGDDEGWTSEYAIDQLHFHWKLS